jgi:hypothetical protein
MNNTKLRTVVATISEQIANRPGAGEDALATAWSELLALLALGPEPQDRACPNCGEIGMGAATRCRRCWQALTPPKAEGPTARKFSGPNGPEIQRA